MILLFFMVKDTAAQDTVQHTILLIGDAGQLTGGRQLVVDAARKNVPLNKNTSIVYLGDNLYKTGLPDNALPTYDIAKAPLDSQIMIAGKSPVNVFFIPGNHDWANGGVNGYESILRVQNYIDVLGNKYVRQLPRDGCAGPEEVKINDDITLVIVDSQWWLHTNDKPGTESDCPYKTKTEVLVALDEIFAKNDRKLVIFAMHHPMRSYGQHGGYFTLKQHIFPFTDAVSKLYIPLPLIGSAYPLTRAVFGTAQDLKHPLYQEMIHAFEKAVKPYPNVIFVSGHEHTLQMIKDSTRNYIVSGSGSKSSRVSKSRNTLYASSSEGFVTLQVSTNKNVRASFFEVDGDSVTNAFTENILNFSRGKEIQKQDTLRKADYVFKNKVSISASDKYKRSGKLKKFLLGSNYRREWNTAVEFKVFNISTEQGGFKIKSLGGGKQTKSLKLEDKYGHEWSLRSVDKDPEKALPENLRGTVGQAIVTDVISASNPYAPLVVPALAQAAGVPFTKPVFFFVPDDPALGKYQKVFANTVCMLENRQPGPAEKDTKTTNKIINKILEDDDHHVDQPAVLNARLLDMYIGDFDRHADQWRWGTADTGKGKLYYPVPKDRDQAFFKSNGAVVKYLSFFELPFLKGFDDDFDHLRGLNFVAKDFDRTFLNSINRQQWDSISAGFVAKMTNAVIDSAVLQYPKEIQPLMAAKTAAVLKGRRKDFVKSSSKYYRFLSKNVTVTGSNENEYFHIQQDGKGLKLSVYGEGKKADTSSLMYRRTFLPGETKELILFGFNGNDKFDVDANVSSKIKLRIVGGKGKDSFDLKGNVRSKLYDLNTEKNVLLNTKRASKNFSANPSVLAYKATGFQYNKTVPQLNAGFNAEDRVLLGLGFTSKTYGFRKEPFAVSQKLTTLAALNLGAFQARYEGIFNQLIFNRDLIVKADVVTPTLSNFFGYGNETVYNKDLPLAYYRTRYKYVTGDVLIRKRYNDIFSLSAGGTYYRYWSAFEDNKSRILGKPSNAGKDSMSLYATKQYAGARLKLDIIYVNNEIFPTRGVTWFTQLTSLQGLNSFSKNITDISSDMTIYASISDLSKVSGIIKIGAGKVFSDNYEFFQAKTLGVNNYLRGFRKNRFTGKSVAYGSGELRFKLFKSRSYLLPGDVGLLGFVDVGRVWQPGEESDKWHNSFGTGFYFIPFNALAISASVGFSKEDKLVNFSLGTKFGLGF